MAWPKLYSQLSSLARPLAPLAPPALNASNVALSIILLCNQAPWNASPAQTTASLAPQAQNAPVVWIHLSSTPLIYNAMPVRLPMQ